MGCGRFQFKPLRNPKDCLEVAAVNDRRGFTLIEVLVALSIVFTHGRSLDVNAPFKVVKTVLNKKRA